MTAAGATLLFLAMAAMAALPSSSVALVVARAATAGVASGLAVAAGIVAGDLMFVAMAVSGMAALAEQAGALFALVKYAAAAYLVWLGVRLIRSRPAPPRLHADGPRAEGRAPTRRHLPASFGAGLLLTLGDVKAIFFYASLLPGFVDLAALSTADVATIAAVTIAAVGLVKAAYCGGGVADRRACEGCDRAAGGDRGDGRVLRLRRGVAGAKWVGGWARVHRRNRMPDIRRAKNSTKKATARSDCPVQRRAEEPVPAKRPPKRAWVCPTQSCRSEG